MKTQMRRIWTTDADNPVNKYVLFCKYEAISMQYIDKYQRDFIQQIFAHRQLPQPFHFHGNIFEHDLQISNFQRCQ